MGTTGWRVWLAGGRALPIVGYALLLRCPEPLFGYLRRRSGSAGVVKGRYKEKAREIQNLAGFNE
jgi:hypothetical protein